MSNTTLAELRDINVKKQSESRRPLKSNMTSHIESNMQSHTDDKSPDNTASQPQGLPASPTTGKSVTQPASLPASQFVGNQQTDQKTGGKGGQEAGLSVRERLLAEAQQTAAPRIVMKTVTIKMDPSLDDRVEAHCHALGKKKQDVIQDALLLYFETLGDLG